MSDAAKVSKLLRQQAAIASFGSFALRQNDLLKVLNEAAHVCADGLSVPFSKVCRFRPEENDLFVEAGYGWRPGVVGHVVSRADATSPQGRAFSTGKPCICNDLRTDTNLKLPAFYADHGIVSTIDVLIKGGDRPYGVLEIDNDQQHDYDQHDIDFLTGFANVLAEAVATSERTTTLETNIQQMKLLLDQKNVLAEELQHRVRNSLQLVYGMLNKQLDDTIDAAGKRGIAAIARRVSTLAQVYDHLLGTEITRTTDFGSYVKSLCADLASIHAESAIGLECTSDTLVLDLDAVTALGIVVTELVTNSFEHAFPGGKGEIKVSVRRHPNDNEATIIIADNGIGFTPDPLSKRHGLGLMRRLIEQVGGTVVTASNEGTVWTISVPITIAMQPARAFRQAEQTKERSLGEAVGS